MPEDPKELADFDRRYLEWQRGSDKFSIRITDFIHGLDYLVTALSQLPYDATDEQIMVPFYDAAKSSFGEAGKSIREFFRYLYALLFGTEQGPRWSQFVTAFGRDQFLNLVEERTRDFV